MTPALVAGLGLLIGLALGSLGGGGSVLAVPVLAHLAGQPAAAATATSLVAVGASAAGAAGRHARAGRVRWGVAAVFVAVGVPGSWAGAELNGRLDGETLLVGFSVLVLVAAHRMLTACPSCTRLGEAAAIGATAPVRTERRAAARRAAAVLVAGTVVGFLTGLFGVGGGFVVVPALTLALHLTMPEAVGTSLAVVLGNAAVALAIRGLGAVEWAVALPFTAAMLAGSVAGAALGHRLPAERSLHAFAGLLVAVAVVNAVLAVAG